MSWDDIEEQLDSMTYQQLSKRIALLDKLYQKAMDSSLPEGARLRAARAYEKLCSTNIQPVTEDTHATDVPKT